MSCDTNKTNLCQSFGQKELCSCLKKQTFVFNTKFWYSIDVKSVSSYGYPSGSLGRLDDFAIYNYPI